jgi:hypothetical protein
MKNSKLEILTLDSNSPKRSNSFYSPRVNNISQQREKENYDESIDSISQIKSKTKFSNFEESPYQLLENKFNNLKEKYNNVKKDASHWRNSYFNLLKDSICFDETIKNLYEENRIHLEFIISLENKINKLLVSCNNITNNFHQNIQKSINLENINLPINTSNSGNNNSFNNSYIKNFNEVLNDYKKQLEILADEKDNLNTNLSISRHQQLQSSIKLEELQDRVYRIEQSRYDDLKALQNL